MLFYHIISYDIILYSTIGYCYLCYMMLYWYHIISHYIHITLYHIILCCYPRKSKSTKLYPMVLIKESWTNGSSQRLFFCLVLDFQGYPYYIILLILLCFYIHVIRALQVTKTAAEVLKTCARCGAGISRRSMRRQKSPSLVPKATRQIGSFPQIGMKQIQVSHDKNPRILSMKYCLVNRDPYNGLLFIMIPNWAV